MSQLTCTDVSAGYNGKSIISGVSFNVNAGDYLFIIGENGSGKSTLMKTILGLHAPMSGRIELDDGLKRNEIGYLPQQTDIQKDFPASVAEVVISGCLNRMGSRPFYGLGERGKANANMESLGISGISRKCYRELSGGQQQRVLLARALCAADKMLLLDEPVAGLDPAVTREMYGLLLKLNRERKITVIMISHDIDAAAEYATHILQIGDGVFFGTKDEYLRSPKSVLLRRKGGEGR